MAEDDELAYEWPRHVLLPLWREPDERAFHGWIEGGQVRPADGRPPRAMTGAGGEAWTHRCHLGLGGARVTTIGLDHRLVLLEIEGDWMRVLVEQPDRSCDDEPQRHGDVSRHEGRVRWRDEARGPWVWVYTRGC